MKIKNITGILAGALAVCAACMPWDASAAGAIRRMDSTKAYPESAPARIADEVTFRMILDNNTVLAPYDSPWKLHYTGSAEAFDLFYNPPMIAVKISGETRYARLVSVAPYGTSSKMTEIKFAYTVKPGDMAAPMEVAYTPGGAFTFLNLGFSSLWDIRDDNGNQADLSFRDAGDVLDSVAINANHNLTAAADELGEGPVYIKTLDFDTVETEKGYWREIAETTEVASPSRPRIVIPGGAATNGTVFVWISDETGTNISETVGFASSMETQPNAYGQKVHPVTITAGDKEVFFDLKGLSTNGTGEAYIYLSAAPQNSFATGNYMISNFTYRVVKVTEAPEPYVWFTVDKPRVTCPTDWEKEAAVLTVHLSHPYAEPVTIDLGLKTATMTADELFATNALRLSDLSTGTPSWLNKDKTVTVKAYEQTAQVYIYALGACQEDISFTPQILAPAAAASYYREPKPGDGVLFNIDANTPQVTLLDQDAKPVTPPVFALTEKNAYTFHLLLSDSYRCSQNTAAPEYVGYTVKWDRESDKASTAINPQTFTNIVPVVKEGKLVLPVTVTYPYAGNFANTKIRVTNADGGFAELPAAGDSAIVVNVGASMKAYATPDKTVYGEGETAEISFSLSEAYVDLDGSQLFAFLEPLNEAASNTTVSAQWAIAGTNELGQAVYGTGGIAISDTASVGAARVTLKDGYSETVGYCVPRFGVRFCTSQTFDPTKEITAYSVQPVSVAVTNAMPVTQRMICGDSAVQQSGGVFEVPVVVGVETDYEIVPTDKAPEFDMGGTTIDNCMIARWAFKGATDTKWEYKWKFYVGANEYSNRCSYAFYEPDSTNNQIKVTLIDKDMRQPGDIYWVEDSSYEEGGYWKTKSTFDVDALPSFTAYVSVSRQPTVLVQPSLDYFTEADALNGDAYFTVSLSETADKPIDVTLHVARVKEAPAGTENLGMMEMYEYTHTFPRKQGAYGSSTAWRVEVNPDLFDGTSKTWIGDSRFRVWATVTSTTRPNGSLVPFNQLYASQTNTAFAVENTPPTFDMTSTSVGGFDENTETNRYTVEKNVPIAVKWRVSDVLPDLTNRMSVTVKYGLVETNFIYTSQSKFDVFEHTVTGAWSLAFTDSGEYTVTVMAIDKDNGRSYHTWYFTVASSKNVFLKPLVQDGALVSTDTGAAPYVGAKARGKGSGRVWAGEGIDSGFLYNIANFKHQWIYKPSARSSTFYALGYKVGDREGSLTPNQPIDEDGNSWTAGNQYYVYPDTQLDSFFYRYVVNVASANGGAWTTTFSAPQPQYGKEVKGVEGSVSLAEEDDDPTKSYEDILVEAVFSKEYYPADNMGDINYDGIPDYFAVAYKVGGANTQDGATDNAGAQQGAGDGASAEDDLKNVSDANDDNDFLPAAFNSGNPFQPGRLGWGPGLPFTFRYEIRGAGMGLNEPGVSDFDLTDAETMALLADWAAAGNTPTGVWADDCAAAQVWAKAQKWSIERRLDPTQGDTDGDGLDDGTEYFFWYFAKAGAFVDGTWKRLAGSQFSVENPGMGTPIPSWAVAALFDPLVHREGALSDGPVSVTMIDTLHAKVTYAPTGESVVVNVRDFDGDGLYDFEEIALGLNPAHWDSDGDGMSDAYEVINGLDPLDAGDGVRSFSVTDYRNNPDRDFMAWMDSTNLFSVITVRTGDDDTVGQTYAINADEALISLGELVAADGSAPQKDAFLRIKTEGYGEGEYFVSTNGTLKTVVAESGTEYLAVSVRAYSVLDFDGTTYLGAPAVLPAGLALTKADTPEEVGPAAVTSVTLRGQPIVVEGKEVAAGGTEVFRYGNAAGPLVPVPLDGASYSEIKTNLSVSAFIAATNLVYLHHQVLKQNGFDPRTGWSKNVAGYVATRWERKEGTSEGESSDIDYSGFAMNTAPYSSLDEYLLFQYRSRVKDVDGELRARTVVLRGAEQDVSLVSASYLSGDLDIATFLAAVTTHPNVPVLSDPSAGTEGEGEGETASTPTYTSSVHGADTDADGIPDGWELYVNINPNLAKDATSLDNWALDGGSVGTADELNYLEEYAGTDSTAAYSNRYDSAGTLVYPGCETIVAHHPGAAEAGKLKNWYNKFFPTDPNTRDTDGDGVWDHGEGSSWSGWFYVGRNVYQTTFNFIYGEPADNGTSRCIAGAGLNPCTVDTDEDLLPDQWEFEFAGAIFQDGAPVDKGVGASSNDVVRLVRADGLSEACPAEGFCIRGGMDGTVKDANRDYDHDGLMNYQEYLVQSLRHLRYDDAETPLMGRQLYWDEMKLAEGAFIGFVPMSAWDGEAFYEKCKAMGFTGGSAFKFRELGYFAVPPRAWDPVAIKSRRIMLRPFGLASRATPVLEARAPQTVTKNKLGDFSGFERNDRCAYASTDPRRWDSDCDGLDDYYELFHGLNPLLGSAADPLAPHADGFANARHYDRIAAIYGGEITSWRNAWTGWNNASQPLFDAMRFPWMMGAAECDADGDGLRNSEEGLFMNLTTPSTTHTDPTPLWMTDASAKSSYVSQYYLGDPDMGVYADIFTHLEWNWTRGVVVTHIAISGAQRQYMFAFEENEGYDTDHDFIPDNQELVKNVMPPSDPLAADDPARRQALWFSGNQSAAVSAGGTLQHPASSSYDMLRQFTVEAWVKPDTPQAGREQIILERVSNYGGSSLSNAAAIIRANFRLGITADGRYFGTFESTTANGGAQTIAGPAASTNWTHVALTFDGSTFALHVNGSEQPMAQASNVALIPANGIVLMEQESGTVESGMSEFGYQALPCAFILGARAIEAQALTLGADTKWTAYGDYFAGWIDEVRVWNGARSGAQINETFETALTREQILAWRQEAYERWLINDRTEPYLLQHYNFAGLPGAVEAADVAVEPSGFTQNVTDQVRVDGKAVPGQLACGWWRDTPVRSTVYDNAAIVPWIANTITHLPFFDGSTVDSQYWSAHYAGMLTPEEAERNLGLYTFPNSANPYPYYNYIYDRFWHLGRLEALDLALNALEASTNSNMLAVKDTNALTMKWRYELERGFVGTSDLVPLGGAFAKRATSHWDGNGPMDAWTQTVLDRDGDSLPDWWEALYAGLGANPDKLDWTTLVDYWGTGKADTPAWEAYLRDLAKGMLPGGEIADAFRANGDSDKDGIPDFWEGIYGTDGKTYADASADPDRDGLPNFAEYLAEALGYWRIDPMLSASGFNGQSVPDYYLPVGKLYLGAMFTDHDMVEDIYEDTFAHMSRTVYDAHADGDANGWSNWSEVRAARFPETWIQVATETNLTVHTFATDSLEHKLFIATNLSAISKTEIQDVKNGAWKLVADDPTLVGRYATRYTVVGSKPIMAYGGKPQPKVAVKVTYNGLADVSEVVVKAWTGTDTSAKPAAVWSGAIVNADGTLALGSPDEGMLKEGRHTFEIAAVEPKAEGEQGAAPGEDAQAVAAWKPGLPYGVATDVDVGFAGAEFAVELTDTNPSVMRIDLAAAIAANDFASQEALNDRGVLGMPFGPNVAHGNPGTEMASGAQNQRVRIVQTSVNDMSYLQKADGSRVFANEVVYDRFLNLAEYPCLTEANLLSDKCYDLDQDGVAAAAQKMNLFVQNVTSMTYRIVIGDGSIEPIATNNALATMFVNVFEKGALGAQTPAVPMAPANVLKDAQPTFRWTHANTIGKAYPAFTLRVYKQDGTLVYDSGVRRAPAKDASGVYAWTADDLHVGEAVGDGTVFANNAAYYWTVSMLDAKFNTPNTTERKMAFQTAVDGSGGTLSDKGSIAVAVRYFGPVAASADTAALAGLVRVEAFARPDFAGAPVAAAYVESLANIANPSNAVWNAVLTGVPAGTWYVRAYIDTDGDRTRSAWETWGYGNYAGTDREDIYTARAYTVQAGAFEAPSATLILEDADTNNNGIADGYEWKDGKLPDSVGRGVASPYIVTLDEEGVASFDLFANIRDDVMTLPYVSILRNLRNGGALSTIQLAMLGIPLANAETDARVRITSFSPEKGVTLSVATPTSIGGTPYAPAPGEKVSVEVSFTLWHKATLDADWTAKLSVKEVFPVNEVDGQLDAAKLDALNAKIKAAATGASGFFKVTVE